MAVIPDQSDSAVKNMVGATSPALPLGEIMAQRTASLKPYKEDVEAKTKKAAEFEAEKEVFKQKQIMREAGEKYSALTAAQQKAEAAYKPVEDLEEEMSHAKFVPTQESAKDLAALYGLIGVVGWAIGSGGKGNAMRAMAAQNGMLEGYQKGRADLYKKEKDLFEENIKALREKAKIVSDKARRVAELAAKDPQAAAELSRYVSGQEGAEFYLQNADKFGYAKAAKDAEDTYKAAGKIYEEIVKEHFRAARRTGKPQPMTGSDGNTYQLFPDGTVEKVDLPAGVKLTKLTVEKTPKAGKEEKSSQTQSKAEIAAGFGTGPSALVEEFIGDRLPTKQAEPIVQSAAAIGEANQLKKIVRADPGIVGREGQVRQFVNRYIDSALSGTKLPSDKDSGLSQEALLFAKRYASYLVNYERSLAPGARGFTVFFQKRFNDLMQPNQFNAAGMLGLLDDQIREVATQATRISKKANVDNLSALGNSITSRAESTTTPIAAPTTTKKSMPSGDKLSTYTKAHPEFGGDEEKAKAFLRSQGYE